MVMVWLDLVLEKMPSLKFTSAASTFMLCAAIALALTMTFSPALWKAAPDIVAERDPPVPSPKNTLSVSPWMYSMSFGWMPSLSATTCLNVVSWPWPWLMEPEKIDTVPPRSKRISAPSKLGAAARSIVLDMPSPRSLPRFFDSALRLAKPATSAIFSAMSMPFSNSPEL